MKKSMMVAGLFQAVVALVLAAPAVAQQSQYTIQIPFQFHADGRVLPAGEYRIGTAAPGAVQIHDIDRVADATFGAPRVNPSSHAPHSAEIVFHRYGQQYFLSQVWFAGGGQGYGLPVSGSEREYARQIHSAVAVLRAAR